MARVSPDFTRSIAARALMTVPPTLHSESLETGRWKSEKVFEAAAIEIQHRPVDVGRRLRGQEGHHAPDLRRLADPAQGDLLLQLLQHRGRQDPPQRVRPDEARGDDVGRDAL